MMHVKVISAVCGLVGHWRSKRHARRSSLSWRSECRICGTPLRRVAPGHWVPIEDPARDGSRPTSSQF